MSTQRTAAPPPPHPAPATPELSVVVPFYDEADNAGALVDEVAAALDGRLRYELVAVDDGSRDATLSELVAARRRHGTHVRVLRHRVNRGQSAAIVTGVRAARSEWVATLDGDRQNDPADIARLLAVLRAPDAPPSLALVCGLRARRHDSWLRRVSSRVANTVRARLLHDDTPDTGCGLKVFRRQTFLELPAFDHMHRFLPALFQRAGATVVSVPVTHRPRPAGRSKYGLHNRLWVGLVDLAGVRWLQRRDCRVEVEELEQC